MVKVHDNMGNYIIITSLFLLLSGDQMQSVSWQLGQVFAEDAGCMYRPPTISCSRKTTSRLKSSDLLII